MNKNKPESTSIGGYQKISKSHTHDSWERKQELYQPNSWCPPTLRAKITRALNHALRNFIINQVRVVQGWLQKQRDYKDWQIHFKGYRVSINENINGCFQIFTSSSNVGGTTPDTHGRPHGLRPQGRPNPQDEALRGTTLLGVSRKAPGRYPEDTTRSVRIRMIPWFL